MINQSQLLQLRQKHGLTQPEMAKLIGRKLRMYQYYESGQYVLPKGLLELLEFKLGDKGR